MICQNAAMHPFRVALLSMLLLAFSAAHTSAEPFAYVLGLRAGTGESVVTVIDTATNARIGSVPLAQQGCNCFNPHGITASRDGSRVYVSNVVSSTVSVIDTRTNTVVGTFNAGTRPGGLVVSPDGSRLYVINSVSQPTLTAVRVLHTLTGVMLGSIPLSVSNAFGIAITPDGSRLYVTTVSGLAGNDVVKVISTGSNTVIATIPVGNLAPGVNTGSFPIGVDVAPDGSVAYVAVRHAGVVNNISHGAVVGISTTTNTVVSTTNVNVNPHPVRVSPDATTVYVGHNGIPFTTAIIARATNAVVGSIPGTVHAHSMALTPDGTRGYVVNRDGFVYALNLAARTMAATLPFNATTEGVPEAVTVASPPVPVRPPTALSATSIVGNTVTLQWTPPTTGPAPTQYVVEGGLSPGQVLGTLPTGSASSSFTFAAPTGTFFVRVHALAGASRSDPSNEIQIAVNLATCTAPPGPPTNLQVSKAGNVISVSWGLPTSGSAPTGYVLNVTGSFIGAFSTTSRAVSGSAGPGSYGLSVVATNDCGSSAPTAVQTVAIP
jgi:YVTN family beta-propeller protein